MGTNECLRHILARRGYRVPIDDGRRIALILHGGLMTGIRGAGAMIALQELGLNYAFDLILCNSAGFANASYLLAHDVYRGTSIYYEELASRRFVNLWRPSKIVNIDYAIEVMRFHKPLDIGSILQQRSALQVALYNRDIKRVEYCEASSCGPDEYFTLLRASMTLPLLDRHSVIFREARYQDVNLRFHAMQHIQTAVNAGCTDILVIYNRCQQSSFESIPPDAPVLAIAPEPQWQLSRLETNANILRDACTQMGHHVKKTFGFNQNISLL